MSSTLSLLVTQKEVVLRFSEYKHLIRSDYYRIAGSSSVTGLVVHLFRGESFKYIFWMRTGAYLKSNRYFKYTTYPIARFFLGRARYKLGITIPVDTKVGSGLYIGHFGGIIVNYRAEIGKNCNLSQGVTLGQANRGQNKGHPVVGDNVYIGPGAKIVGAVRIGDNVAIGANCVVTKDVPEGSVVVGVPGKVISQAGSKGYINRTDYEDKI